MEMGRWPFVDRDILNVFDAGYDAPRTMGITRW